ncbi:MAG: hypothetical protein LBB72_04680 [Spirochaetaceae bacterium]|jgi:hypothetical protein|nr:hypothetical protein [Spirochaetaceae bacterium]
MDKGLFETLLYLIPVAFFIAIRIIGSKNAKNAENRNSRAEEQRKAVKKPPAKKPPGKSSYHPLFPDAVSTAGENVPVQSVAAGKIKSGMTARSSALQAGVAKPGLTPLQQAVVWAEILGTPKGA